MFYTKRDIIEFDDFKPMPDTRPLCECGSVSAVWRGGLNGLRSYQCAECYNQLEKSKGDRDARIRGDVQ